MSDNRWIRVWVDVEDEPTSFVEQLANQGVMAEDTEQLNELLVPWLSSEPCLLFKSVVYKGIAGSELCHTVNGNPYRVFIGVRHGWPAASARFVEEPDESCGYTLK